MRAYYLACFMLCVGACATALEPAQHKHNVISTEHISSEFDVMARRHAAAHAKWLAERAPPPKKEAPPPADDEQEVEFTEVTEEELFAAGALPAPPDGIGLQESSFCHAVVTLEGNTLGLVVERYLFGDGAALVACNVFNRMVGFSGTAIQTPDEVTHVRRPCHCYYDLDEPSSGGFFFYVEADGNTGHVIYMDKESRADLRRTELTCMKKP